MATSLSSIIAKNGFISHHRSDIIYLMLKIGENLYRLRKARKLSLRKVARQVGISHTVIMLYERDERYPTIDVVVRICEFFEVPFEYLVLGEKAGNKYRDLELAELMSQADELEKEYRDMVKNYLKRVLSNRSERKALEKESRESPLSRRRTSGKP